MRHFIVLGFSALALAGCAMQSSLPPASVAQPKAAAQPSVGKEAEAPKPAAPLPAAVPAAPASANDEPTIEPGQCWVYAPIRPRPVSETVELTVKDSSTRIKVTQAEIRRGYQQVVTREGTRTYRIEPPTYREVIEKVLVRPEVSRLVVVPAVFEEREEVVTLEGARTVLEPCRSAGTQYARSVGAMSFCAREVPAKTETIKVKALVSPETTRVAFEPAQYKEVRRWVVDQPARAVEVEVPPELASLPLQEVIKPETSTVEQLPPVTRAINTTRFEGNGRVVSRQAVCSSDISTPLVTRLQQRLVEEGYHPGAIDGLLGVRTIGALTDYQTRNGLAVGALTYESLKQLGIQ
ncbi:Peptidoglycan binding domain-containing protein [Thauera humireducens]|uniref:peptidoglycan-binding domain-containing protein n=1 Tax=Thauera humireducens TaxID=1134435 RepID=UPI002467A52B|nr:peptidoglycan-binding domain-containing protein [Thauera humireducens]CAH1746312.1 Peptidoglycan binding domain-containing protein [Thauera humireducens]